MAAVKHARGVKLLLKVGDGADPEVFTQQCSINADRGITFTAGANDQEVIDCEDPDAIAWVLREKTNLSASFNGSGLLNTPDLPFFFAFWKDPESRNCKVIVDVPGADGGIIWSGAWHMTEFGVTGNRGEKAQVSIAMASDGEITSAANA